MPQARTSAFARYAWAVLAWNVGVVLWGALVRATGAGAGCGNHWPRCNGQVIPPSPSVQTLIEYTHRLMTGADGFLVLALVVLAWRLHPRGSPVRTGAGLAAFFLVTEALVGAALVKLELVAGSRSPARVWWMALHLVNTFLLLASLTLAAWWASGGRRTRLRGAGAAAWAMLGGVVATLAVAVTGAITALGDTLYPKSAVGVREAATATFLERLRIVHPAVAIGTALYVVLAGLLLRRARPTAAALRLSRLLVGLFVAQVLAGTVNVLLLAPVWMQLVHLFIADAVWITLVCATAAALALPEPAAETVAARAADPAEGSPLARLDRPIHGL
ncbi:MAG TPA: COX15/CtaA family protein [Longimicrobiaceae bacterium]|nr:COX15/CtaA family protein [Longimicrobiaceae bacterium]